MGPQHPSTHGVLRLVLRLSGEKETGNTFDINDPSSLMASLKLGGGNYVVNTTYTLIKDTGGLAVECQLRAGGRHDTDNFFGGGGQIQQGSAMSVTAHVNSGQKAQVRCDDGSAATTSKIQNLEITATKLPKITTKTVAP